MVDLPPIDFAGIADPFEKFEMSMPFNRTLLAVMMAKIEEAHKECGGLGWVTVNSLAKVLPTRAWSPLKDPESKLVKTLTSGEFRDPKESQAEGQIDVNILTLFCLFHCSGKPFDRATVFYGILQDGGLDAHEEISAQDKDFKPIFIKMCKLVTMDIFNLTRSCGETNFAYDESTIRKILDDDNLEIIREEDWLDTVYGHSSLLKNDRWLQKVSTDGSWIFSSVQLRQRIFSQA